MAAKSDKSYRVSIECVNGYPPRDYHWVRKLEIPESHSLLQIHWLMIDLLDFEDDHLFEFFGSRDGWRRHQVLVESDTYDEHIEGYQSLRLADVYPLPRLRLYYRFDLGNKWTFAFKNPRRVACRDDIPLLLEESGENPRQYPEPDFYF